MNSDWPLLSLSELIEIKHGWAFKGSHMSEKATQGPVVVAIGNFDYSGGFRFSQTRIKRYTGEYPEEYQLQPGDILLAMTCQTAGGEILGLPGVIPKDDEIYLHNQRLGKLSVKDSERICAPFLYWIFLSYDFNRYLAGNATGTKILHTSPSKIVSYETRIPPINTQKSIANTLWSIDDKIQLNHQINQTLEQIAQAIFKSWFVDFEPVKAKIAALEAGGSEEVALLAAMQAISGKTREDLTRLQAEQPKQYTELRATAELFPSAMQESELGEIPEGWRSGSLSDICDFQNGYAFKSKDWSDSGFAVVKIGSVKPEFVDLQSCSYVQENTVTGLERFELHAGDLLVGMTGYPGETGLVPISDNRIFLNQRVGRLRPKQQYHNALAYCSVRAPAFKQYVEGQAHGSAQANVSGKAIQQYALAIPTDSIANRFAGQVEPLLKQKLLLNAESSTLSEIRDTLLPKLLSGELSLSDANDLITEAAEPANV